MNIIGAAPEEVTDKIKIKDWKETKRFLGFLSHVSYLSCTSLFFVSNFRVITGSKGKSHSIDLTARDTANQDSVITLETSTVCDSENHKNETSSVVQHEDIAVRPPKKSHKLHWGYDVHA